MNSSQSEPRRSQRAPKPVKRLQPAPAVTGKRKRKQTDTDADSDGSALTDAEQLEPEADQDDDDDTSDAEDDRAGTARTKASPTKRTKPAGNKEKTKRSVQTNGTRATKATRAPAGGRGRKAKQAKDASFDPDQLEKEARINADNPLFNAIINPTAALQTTVEDFLESLDQSPGAAQAELINLILRCCGCNDTVNSDEVVDYDGVVDALDNFTEGLKKDESPTYPLTSKLPMFKKFRVHLSEFISRLVASSAETGSLYKSDLMGTLQTWVIAMNSSQIRSFRHTATVVALELQSALCDVARTIEKEVETVGRQREGEKKRRAAKGGNDKMGGGVRDKELERKMREVNGRKTKVTEFINEFDTGVFIHRYRDLDPVIRAECVTSLGVFFKKLPSLFLTSNYLRYVGWVLSDVATNVRLAAVKSLQTVYALSTGDADHLLNALNHFTERFKARLLEMAEGDIDIGVRVGVLTVLGEVDKTGLLEEDDRHRLCRLIFSEDPKVRKAVAKFVKTVWEEWIDEYVAELEAEKGASASPKKRSNTDRARIGYKGLAALLVKWGKALDEELGDDEEENGTQAESQQPNDASATLAVSSGVRSGIEGRIPLAVEALWDDVDPVTDWEGILNTLLLDHTASGNQVARSKRAKPRSNGKKRRAAQDDEDEDADALQVDDAWRLEEIEETSLLQIMTASLRKIKKELVVKKGEEDAVWNDLTRALIKGLPRLFIKYQTDKTRIAEVLVLPTLMNLDLYMEMRMLADYATLWDDVTKQLMTHSSMNILVQACNSVAYFMEATSLSNTNSSKILELEDQLSRALRDAVEGREELEISEFTADETLSLTALSARLRILAGLRDMSAWTDENEGGLQSSIWQILEALAERGRLGYKEEEEMIHQILGFLALHLCWKCKHLTESSSPSPEEIRYRESFLSQRESLINKLTEYVVGTQSNAIEQVKRAAFKNMLDLYVLFSSPLAASRNVTLSMDDETQYRCTGYVQAEIEQYADQIVSGNGEEMSEEDSDGENAPARKRRRKQQVEDQDEESTSQAHLTENYAFVELITTFVRALKTGAIHVRHASAVLAHFGRLGSTFDQCCKYIIDILKEEGLSNDQSDIIISVVTQSMQEAGSLVIEGVTREEKVYQLGKALSSSFLLRGTHLAVVRKLASEHIVQIQLDLLSWLVKRLTSLQQSEKERGFRKALSLFRTLNPLLSTLQSRDGLKIKAHLDQTLAQAKVHPSPTLKAWESYRAYEKRLTGLITKGKAGTKKLKDKGKTTALSEDEEEESEVEKLMGDESADEEHHAALDHSASEAEDPTPATPQPPPRPRPRATYGKRASPQKNGTSESVVSPTPLTNGFATPIISTPLKHSKKRGREEPEDDGLSDDPSQGNGMFSEQAAAPESPGGDIHIRRKRIRH